jgi:N4-(beta-N-acetylglucosaminyl)-L-asparaginase
MHGPLKRAGGVAALEGVKTPSRVAREVMNQTDHHLLVGKGAQTFARNLGFEILDDLNTPLSRKLWLEWKEKTDPKHYLTPESRAIASARAVREMRAEGRFQGHAWGTINCDGVNEGRDLRRRRPGPLLQIRTRRRLADSGRRAYGTGPRAPPARLGRGD